jgi:flagellar biosynthesis protein FlhF
MRLKSFHARTMSEAMRQVRQALGDEAIIVATREEQGGGVRVTAAVEEDDFPASGEGRGGEGRGGGRSGGRGGRGDEAPSRPAPEPQIDVGEVVADALHRHGTPAALAEQMVDAISGLDTGDPTLALGAALDSVFTFNPLPEARAGGKPLVLVGPPGSGKTLTVAKLAARAVFKNRSVGVITTDTVRAGGVDQLAAFMRLLKVKLLTVEDPEALSGAIGVNRGVDLMIIDTAGRNPFDTTEMADLKALLTAASVEPVLVLPAGLDAMEAADTGLAFRSLGVRRMLLTRLDVARRLGSSLAAAHRSRLAFCDGTIAPKVAEGLTQLNPVALARLILPGKEKPQRAAKSSGARSGEAKSSEPRSKTMSSPSSRSLP